MYIQNYFVIMVQSTTGKDLDFMLIPFFIWRMPGDEKKR